jgi:hypothetical protein
MHFQREQELGLRIGSYWQTKRRGHHPEHVRCIQLSADQVRCNDFFGVQLIEQRAHEHGLARSNFTRNNEEAFALVQSIFKVRQRPLMNAASEEKCRVGI